MKFLVPGCVLFIGGLLLALDFRGLGAAWIRADLWLTKDSSDAVMAARTKRRRAYFWVLVALGALLIIRGAFGLA